MKKNTPLLVALVLGLSSVLFQGTTYAIPSYDSFQNDIKTFCQTGAWYDTQEQLIRSNVLPYYPVESLDKNAKNYFDYMKNLGVSRNQIMSELGKSDFVGSDEPLFLPSDAFDLAHIAYRETMNDTYKCAVLNVRLVTGQHILDTKPADQSAMAKKLKKEADQIKQQMTKYKCRIVTDANSQDPSLKIQLLNNTTYQYCVYRYYLQDYLSNLDDNLLVNSALFKNGITTENLPNAVINKKNEIDNEITRTRDLYKLSIVSYGEFERAYELHLWLTFLFEDYINVRNNLQSLLNPVGQVVYKIANAQSPGN